MSERSCSIPLVVRLRGVPDEGHLAEMRRSRGLSQPDSPRPQVSSQRVRVGVRIARPMRRPSSALAEDRSTLPCSDASLQQSKPGSPALSPAHPALSRARRRRHDPSGHNTRQRRPPLVHDSTRRKPRATGISMGFRSSRSNDRIPNRRVTAWISSRCCRLTMTAPRGCK